MAAILSERTGQGMILIHNCRLVDPASGTDARRDILTEGGRIRQIAEPGTVSVYGLGKGDLKIDADGLIAVPGLVDTHVHFRDPGALYKKIF